MIPLDLESFDFLFSRNFRDLSEQEIERKSHKAFVSGSRTKNIGQMVLAGESLSSGGQDKEIKDA